MPLSPVEARFNCSRQRLVLLRPGALGIIYVAATGVEFEGLVLVLGGGEAVVNVDSASLLSRPFSRGVPAVDDVDALSIFSRSS